MADLVFHKIDDNARKISFECVMGREVENDFPFHIHHTLCIGLITGGMRWITFPEYEICIQENELFVVNPLQPHAIQRLYPHDYVVITVKGLTDCPVFHAHIQSLQCKRLFINLLNAIQLDDSKELPAAWDKLFAYLCRYQCKITAPSETNVIMQKTMDYISVHYQNPITVSDLAKHNCMSVYHFCRTFKSATGMSPHNYLIQYRLSKSRKSLQAKESIFNAAVDAGFYDSSHLIRNFTKYMAISPESYRQSILKKSKNIQ